MNNYKRVKPNFKHLNVGDTITITKELKESLELYDHLPENDCLKGISERQAQAASVLSQLYRDTRP